MCPAECFQITAVWGNMSDGSFSVAAQFHFDSICQRWIGVQCITLPWLSWPMDEGWSVPHHPYVPCREVPPDHSSLGECVRWFLWCSCSVVSIGCILPCHSICFCPGCHCYDQLTRHRKAKYLRKLETY